MKTQLPFLKFAVLGTLIVGASTARAQGGMPDLSDFAGAIAGAVNNAPPKKLAPTPKGGFSSGLTVPKVNPGEGARAVGHTIRLAIEAKAGPQPAFKQLEDALPNVLTETEKQFTKLGFAPRDMGTAYAFAFIELRDNATGANTPDATAKIAGRSLSSAIGKFWGPKFKTLPAATKENMYETLITATLLDSLFTQQFDKAGKKTEAQTFRDASAKLFEQLVGVPASQVEISPSGEISGLKKDKPADAPTTDAPTTDAPAVAPVTDAPPMDAPAQP